ncbi:MAG: TetR/AcrR family transcriptional regulator [Candidatus Xenobiia bacterium LiM19]
MDNRDNILNAALTLFSSHGYEAVGVQEIVKKAGITKPTLYHYFGSKEGLLNELLGFYSDKLYRVLKKASDYEGDLPLTLINTAQAYIRFAEEYPDFYRLQLSLWFAPPDSFPARAVTGFLEQQYHLIESMFLRAAEDHGNMKGRHQRYALSFIGMINTYIEMFYKRYLQLDDRMVYLIVHQFMHGIYS